MRLNMLYKEQDKEQDKENYFIVKKVSGADLACGMASIYKLIGTNEVGKAARKKAVNELKSHLNNHDRIVRDLVKAELRGHLISSIQELINSHVISHQESLTVALYREATNKHSELVDNLKRKYVSQPMPPELLQLYNIVGGDNSKFIQAIIVRQLLPAITVQEVQELARLSELKNNTQKSFEDLVGSKVESYIDNAVAKPGFELGVVGNSPGVMGALAYIHGISFKVLKQPADFEIEDQLEEDNVIPLVECSRYIHPNPQAEVKYLILQTGLGNKEGFHFDILEKIDRSLGDEMSVEEQVEQSKAETTPKKKKKSKTAIEKVQTLAEVPDDLINQLEQKIRNALGLVGDQKLPDDFDHWVRSLSRDIEKNQQQRNIALHNEEYWKEKFKELNKLYTQRKHDGSEVDLDGIKEILEELKALEIERIEKDEEHGRLTLEMTESLDRSKLEQEFNKIKHNLEKELLQDKYFIDHCFRKALNSEADIVHAVNDAIKSIKNKYPGFPCEIITDKVLPKFEEMLKTGKPGENLTELRIKAITQIAGLIMTGLAFYKYSYLAFGSLRSMVATKECLLNMANVFGAKYTEGEINLAIRMSIRHGWGYSTYIAESLKIFLMRTLPTLSIHPAAVSLGQGVSTLFSNGSKKRTREESETDEDSQPPASKKSKPESKG